MTDQELKQMFDSLRQENANAHDQTRRRFDVAVEQTRRHFDVAVERMEGRFHLLAGSVQHLDEKLDLTRVTLEDAVANLQARVGRLESSTH